MIKIELGLRHRSGFFLFLFFLAYDIVDYNLQ